MQVVKVRGARPRCRIVALNGVVEGPAGAPSVSAPVPVDTVLGLFDARRPIERCLAAKDIPPEALERMVSSPSLARNLRRVGRSLHPSLKERARRENPPLRALIHCAWGDGFDEQQRRWDALAAGTPGNDVVFTRNDPPTATAA